ncbi:MAG: hypothetical protein WCJ05_01190 [bacterium]
MKLKFTRLPNKYKSPLLINGLKGNIYMARSTKNQNILYLGNIVSGIEINWQLINYLRSYGSVTAVDIPGIGGMDNFSVIGKKPTIDNYVDYLVSLIKLRYKNKKFIIVADGFGFVIATKLLIKYPKYSPNVKMIVAINGALSKNCFNESIPTVKYLRFLRFLSLNETLFKKSGFQHRLLNTNPFVDVNFDDSSFNLYSADKKYLDSLIVKGDRITHISILNQLRNLDIKGKIENIPVWNIQTINNSLNKKVTEDAIKEIYTKYHQSSPKLTMDDLIFNIDNSLSRLFTIKLRKKLVR